MHVTDLHLSEFRSFRRLDTDLPSAGFGLVGANAAGKSTVLEAIAMLATTRSARSSADRDVINWDSGKDLGVAPFARIAGSVSSDSKTTSIEIGLELPANGERRLRKTVSVGGQRVGAAKAVGTLKCSLFEPVDIELVAGSPAVRRRYLDVMLSQIERSYISALTRYTRIVEQRNGLLKSLIQDGHSPTSSVTASQLDYWDNELVANGSTIRGSRLRAVSILRDLAANHISSFMGSSNLRVTYVTAEEREGWRTANQALGAGNSELSDAEVGVQMSDILKSVRTQEFRRGVTLVGPHRDDLSIEMDGVPLGAFGSRGQQRLGAVAMKLAEAEFMNVMAGDQPVILLDDVLSELDERHRGLLVTSISRLGTQVIVTATERSLLESAGLTLPAIATLESGNFAWSS